ncbi:MAG TPA: hypothetical protein EYG19_06195 [Verrucomicrobia bacterium]|nr:hypothetical protein [Verrucomicrobiota bacterium]
MRRRLAIGLMIFLTLLGASAAVTTGVIAEGTRWEMAWRVHESGQPGPTVLVVGGVHGNEPAGASAAGQIQHWPVKRGRLIVVPRANGPGLKDGTRFLPGVALKTRDLNRDFQKTDSKDGPIGEPAQALWKFVSGHKPDWLIDLHEGTDFHQINGKSVGSSIIDVHSKASGVAVPLMLKAVNAAVSEPKKKFVRLRYPVDGSLARAAHERLGAHAMICETTSKNQPRSQRARQHRLMVHALLTHLQMAQAGPHVLVGKDDFRVAIYDAGGVGGNGPRNVDRVLAGHAVVRRVGAADVRDGVLEQFHLAVFPGGSGSKQAKALAPAGRKAVQNFVRSGGGFAGICAGSYLAAANYEWSLGLSNHKTFCKSVDIPKVGRKSMWYRGPSATVQMELTDAGRKILGDKKGAFDVRYHNGPIMSPMGKAGLGAFQPLAHFRSEVSRYEPQKGTMTGTPAIISGHYGKGRVLCISPHPESSPALYELVRRGLFWAGNKK